MSEDNQKSRTGDTKITSVSVSKKFQQLIEEHNMSPTECFRRGIAVTLCDLGVGMYQSEKNEVRSKFMHQFLEKLEADENLKKEYEQMKLFEEIKKHMSAIKNIIVEIEGGEK